jgi:hypothetical protein
MEFRWEKDMIKMKQKMHIQKLRQDDLFYFILEMIRIDLRAKTVRYGISDRIFGGALADTILPWQLGIQFKDNRGRTYLNCGGTLVSLRVSCKKVYIVKIQYEPYRNIFS